MAKPSSTTPKIVTKKHVAKLERERRQVALVRTLAVGMIVLVALLLGYGYLEINYLELRKPVAEVNGQKITTKEWQERIQLQRINLANTLQQYQYYQQTFGLDTSQQQQEITYYLQIPEALGQQVLDTMIDEVLIRQEAEKRGITVSREEVERSIQESYGFFPNGTSTPEPTSTPFEFPTLTSEQLTLYPPTPSPTTAPTFTPEPTSTPDPSVPPTATATFAAPTPTFVPGPATATATPYTLEGFQAQFNNTLTEFKTIGISEATLRSVYESGLLRQKVLEAVTADIPTSEEQVWARHILVATEGEAKGLIVRLQQGADFAKLARQTSTDTGSGTNGGDLGWFGRGQMVSEFENAAFSLKIGEISKPIQSQFGYHIIQVLGRQELPLSASQLQQKRETAFTEWLTSTREAVTIIIYDTWKQKLPPMPDFLAQ
jgi:parvulin-like peptidyl-prolyl isomerase